MVSCLRQCRGVGLGAGQGSAQAVKPSAQLLPWPGGFRPARTALSAALGSVLLQYRAWPLTLPSWSLLQLSV